MSKIKGFIGETLVYGFANVFSRIFAMILIPFYAEYLGKINYSNLIMLQSIFTIMTFMLALNSGVFYYYYQHENLKYRKLVFTSWFYYELVVAIALLLFSIAGAGWLKNLLIIDNNSTELQYSIILFGVMLFPYIFNNTNINLFRINRKPKSAMIIVLLEAIFTLGFVYVALDLLGYGLLGVVVGQFLARFLVALIFTKTGLFYVKIKNYSPVLLKKILAFTWPFFVISGFGWVIISMDKFIGAQTLMDKTNVALLSLAMQLVIPIAVLADMIRMAVGPFVMSIHKQKDADKTYQQVFDLCMYSGFIVAIAVIGATPILTLILTNSSFLEVILVVPLMAVGSILSLAANQFSISFNLSNKNVYILYATVTGGIITLILNLLLMSRYGFIVSGISQIISYSFMAWFLYVVGRKIAKQRISLKNSLVLLIFVIGYLCYVYMDYTRVVQGDFWMLLVVSALAAIILTITYLKLQNLRLQDLIRSIRKK